MADENGWKAIVIAYANMNWGGIDPPVDPIVAAERERCAKIAEEYGKLVRRVYKGLAPETESMRRAHTKGSSDGADLIAARIRSGGGAEHFILVDVREAELAVGDREETRRAQVNSGVTERREMMRHREELFANDPMFVGDPEAVRKIIERFGYRAFMGCDGCDCGSCEIRGVHINTSCHGGCLDVSDNVVRVYYQGTGRRVSALVPLAEEVVRQMRGDRDDLVIHVRFCGYASDNKWACCYCGDRRAAQNDYLCARHNSDPVLVSKYVPTVPAVSARDSEPQITL